MYRYLYLGFIENHVGWASCQPQKYKLNVEQLIKIENQKSKTKNRNWRQHQ